MFVTGVVNIRDVIPFACTPGTAGFESIPCSSGRWAAGSARGIRAVLAGRGAAVPRPGPSGAGKTTFLKLLIRDEAPTSGQIVVNGRNIWVLPLGAKLE